MRRRRRSEAPGTPAEESAASDEPVVEGVRAHGPWDVSERPVDEDDETRAHLGALSVQGHPGVEVRLQVDEASQQVQAVLLVASDGAMELRAFAAPRHEDIWDDVRRRLAAEAARRGGTATPVDGPYGPALQMMVPAVTPDGKQVTQPSTVLGITGPRWLLRVSAYGRPAVEWRPDGPLETALRDVVVIRGSDPMPPGEPLPLRLPAGAHRVPPPA